MKQTQKILRQHFSRYPEMQPADAVKLLFQNAFGGEHLIPDEAASFSRLSLEYDSVPAAGTAASERIGNGYARLLLAGVKRNHPCLSVKTLNRIFVQSRNKAEARPGEAAHPDAAVSLYHKNLELLQTLAERRETPFSETSLADYIRARRTDISSPPRHSEHYRTVYHPAYRVVSERYLPYLALFAEIDRLLAEKGDIAVGIDGRCAAGKSTLADMLALLYDGGVLRADDFFLPAELRTPERLAEPGGNIHYERFLSEAAPGLLDKKPFSYRVFDCAAMHYRKELATHSPKGLSIVEGSYSHRADFRGIYDVTVFLTVGKEEQLRRLAARNPETLNRFIDCWIPMEERYFTASGVEKNAGFVIDTEKAAAE